MAKLKYNEETKIVATRVPISKIEEFKKWAQSFLDNHKNTLHPKKPRVEIPPPMKSQKPKVLKENQQPINTKNDCDCTLVGGLLFRGKSMPKCKKTKDEHKF